MAFSKYGPLAEVFIIDAIAKFAAAVAASNPADYPEHGFVAPADWSPPTVLHPSEY